MRLITAPKPMPIKATKIGSTAGPGINPGNAPSMTKGAPAAMAPPAVKRQKGISKMPGAKATSEVTHPQSHAAFMKLGAD